MADKKNNVGREALNENNLENVSGGMVYEWFGKWVASNIDRREAQSRLGSSDDYYQTFDTKEEAIAFDEKKQKQIQDRNNRLSGVRQ